MKFVDMFCGMGTIRMGFVQAGHECVYSIEWDKHKRKIYEVIFGHEPEASDITAVRGSDLPFSDCWCFGAPCQDFSVAGLREGLDGERSGLVREVFRLVGEKEPNDRPEWLFYENVKGMLSSNLGWDFAAIQAEMGELGYDVQWQLLNSKDFGVPQNRERVYTLGHLRARGRREIFPLGSRNTTAIELSRQGDYTNTITAKTGGGKSNGTYVVENQREAQIKQIGNVMPTATRVITLNTKDDEGNEPPQQDRVYSADGIMTALSAQLSGRYNIEVPCACLTPDRPEKRQNGRRFKEPNEPMFTLTKQDVHGVLLTQKKITRITDVAGTLLARNPSTSCGNFTPITGVLSYDLKATPKSTRRGVIKNGYVGALDTQCNTGVAITADGVPPTDVALTLRSGKHGLHGVDKNHPANGVLQNARIRRLTPRECMRLQGVSDYITDKLIAAGISDTQMYRAAGDACTVNVIYEIARRL